MKPSIELFDLIKSLSKSEKRFFKLTSALQSGDKNYLKIFDYIEKQEEYDEEHLKKTFSKEIFIKHLPSEKNHLYKLILKSLRSFTSEKSIASILAQEIKNIEILYSKALYKECNKLIARSKVKAREHEKFYHLIELINWEKVLIDSSYEAGEFSLNIDKIIKEEAEVIEKLRNLAEYMVLDARINLIFRTGGFSRATVERAKVEEISDNHLIKGKNTALSSKAASICYYVKGLCAMANRNHSDSFTFFNRAREILDNNPKIKEAASKRYVNTLIHLMRCYIEIGDSEKARELIFDIRELRTTNGFKSIDIALLIFSNSNAQELILYQSMGKFQESVDLIPEIEKQHSKLQGKVSKEMELLLHYYKAYSYFGVSDFKQAMMSINIILNDNEQSLRQDIYSLARLVNLIIHYELENYDYLDYLIRSTSRYLNKHEREYKIEILCIKFIKRLSKIHTDDDKEDILKKMKTDVIDMLEDQHENVLLEYFNITAWIDSKIKNVTLGSIIRTTVKTLN